MRGLTPLPLRRALGEPLLLLAALGAVLLATTALAGLAGYAVSATDAGVRRTLGTVPAGTAATVVTAPVRGGSFPATDRAVRAQAAATYTGLPVEVTLSAQSDSYAMPGQERRKRPELLRFGVHRGLREHARLVRGSWPAAGRDGTAAGRGGTVEAAVTGAVASATGFSAGDVITVEGRLDHRRVRVRITGVFELDDPYSDRWDGEPLLTRGSEVGDYVTHGPLMVPEETFVARFAPGVTARWLVVPDLRPVPRERLLPLAAGAGRFQEALRARPGCEDCSTATHLPDRLTRLATATLVARSTMLVPVLELLLLAAYALVLTARLLADHRRMETALLRSRGAGTRWLALAAAGEALLVTLPCAVVAPLLAPWLLRAAGALTGADVRPGPEAGPVLHTVSAAVALGCAVLLTLPALRGARRTYVADQAARGRGERYGAAQRAGADLALLGVAALAVWQLRRYGSTVTATAGGGLGIDPLIVAGPAAALLCGGLLALRVIPPVSRVAERITARRTGLAPALGTWQVSRRPARRSGPALLLTMAVAVGVVSVATVATWRASQRDQAGHLAGADLRVASPPNGVALGPLGRAAAYRALPGVVSLSPAYRAGSDLAGEEVTLLAVDAADLPGMLRLRPDLSAAPVAALATRLAAARPDLPGLPIPGRPERLTLRTRLTVDDPALADEYGAVPLTLVIADAEGVRHPVRVVLGPGESRPTADLSALRGRAGRLAYPLTVAAIVLDVPLPATGSGLELAVERIETDAGTAVTPPPGTRLAHGAATGYAAERRYDTGRGLFAIGFDAPAPRDPYDALAPQRVTFVPVRAAVPDAGLFTAEGSPQGPFLGPLPVVVTADLAAGRNLTTGSRATVTLDRRPTLITVAGIVAKVPGTPPDRPAVLVDWRTMQSWDLLAHRAPRPPAEWWLGTDGADTSAAAAELGRHREWDVTVVDLSSLARGLRDDPLAAGLQGALVLGFLAALVFAALGFAVDAAVTLRERAAEFAVLRALGMGFRQVLGLLLVEQAFLIGLSLAAGTAVALAVAALVVPHLVLTGQATAVTPEVTLEIPPLPALALLAGVAALLLVIVAGLAGALRRGAGRAPLIGEDR
ncbi:ABC transporter permease [Streptosporangium nondiastaticum]|uniref:FtsX-like permease family protein n=1 Tax=Streptosporangium nondiastaticum TaxID=35764 RepID=UPI0031F86A51